MSRTPALWMCCLSQGSTVTKCPGGAVYHPFPVTERYLTRSSKSDRGKQSGTVLEKCWSVGLLLYDIYLLNHKEGSEWSY